MPFSLPLPLVNPQLPFASSGAPSFDVPVPWCHTKILSPLSIVVTWKLQAARRITTGVTRRRAYAVLGFIASDFHRFRPRAFELIHANAMLRVIAYGNHVLRIGLAALRGSGNFGLCTRRRRAQPHRSGHDEKTTHGNLPPSNFWETFGESLAAYSRARRGVKPKNSSGIRSDILISAAVIPECVNLKPSSWNAARVFS
jgi:hypothetical protein